MVLIAQKHERKNIVNLEAIEEKGNCYIVHRVSE